ncbi:MAG: hypothetical protein WDN08_04455 [Rhizomicrobium sp.]
MADEPYFPAPAPRSAYRETADRPLTAADPVPAKVAAPKPIVATRPDPPGAARPRDAAVPSISEVMREDRGYWTRNNLATRHPRVAGALLFGIGAFLTSVTLDTLMHGGRYTTRSAALGPFVLAVGLFLVVVGIPRDEDHRPTAGWKMGIIAASVVGGIAGLVLLGMLGR